MPRVLSTQATMPSMPMGGFENQPLDTYLKALIMSLNDDRVRVGDRIERRVLYGPTSGFPDARGGGDLYYDTTVGDLYIDTGTWDKVFSSVIAHDHDDRYYTETELDAGQLDNRYYTESEVDALLHPESHTIASHSDTTGTGAELNTLTDGSNADSLHVHNYAAASHNHDSRYYTESEVNSLLAGKSDTGHTHDSRYYTETEVDNLLGGYLPLTAGSGEPLSGDLYFSWRSSGGGIIFKNSGGASLTGVGISSVGQILLASTSTDTWIYCNNWVRISGGTLYTSGELVDTEGGNIQLGGGDLLTETGDVNLGSTGKLIIDSLDMCRIISSQRIFGDTSGVTWFEGGNCRMYGPYKTGTSISPGTTQFSSQSWGVYYNSGASRAWFCFSDGSNIYRLELTKY